MSITVATLGGLKLNENIAFKNKIARYKKLKEDFLKYKLTSADGGKYYLPDYFDDVAWKHSYNVNEQPAQGRKVPKLARI